MVWKELSITEKLPFIKAGLESGITDLSVIEDRYNYYAKGGPLSDWRDDMEEDRRLGRYKDLKEKLGRKPTEGEVQEVESEYRRQQESLRREGGEKRKALEEVNQKKVSSLSKPAYTRDPITGRKYYTDPARQAAQEAKEDARRAKYIGLMQSAVEDSAKKSVEAATSMTKPSEEVSAQQQEYTSNMWSNGMKFMEGASAAAGLGARFITGMPEIVGTVAGGAGALADIYQLGHDDTKALEYLDDSVGTGANLAEAAGASNYFRGKNFKVGKYRINGNMVDNVLDAVGTGWNFKDLGKYVLQPFFAKGGEINYASNGDIMLPEVKITAPSPKRLRALRRSRQATKPNTNFSHAQDMSGVSKLSAFVRQYNPFMASPHTCINTVTGFYDPDNTVASNVALVSNPARYGYKAIPQSEVKEGDLIILSNKDDHPVHATMFDQVATSAGEYNGYPYVAGDTLLNYSNGGLRPQDYKKHAPMKRFFDPNESGGDFSGKKYYFKYIGK